MTRTPDAIDHTRGSILINAVVVFNSSVNSRRETIRPAAMRYGRRLESVALTLPPTITGSSGSTHGASTERAPASSESTAMSMIRRLVYSLFG